MHSIYTTPVMPHVWVAPAAASLEIEMCAMRDHLAPLGRAGAVMVGTCEATQVLMGVSTWLHLRNSPTRNRMRLVRVVNRRVLLVGKCRRCENCARLSAMACHSVTFGRADWAPGTRGFRGGVRGTFSEGHDFDDSSYPHETHAIVVL
jgi:hypothetical protein